jgi:hypothetical protein
LSNTYSRIEHILVKLECETISRLRNMMHRAMQNSMFSFEPALTSKPFPSTSYRSLVDTNLKIELNLIKVR